MSKKCDRLPQIRLTQENFAKLAELHDSTPVKLPIARLANTAIEMGFDQLKSYFKTAPPKR